MADRLTQLQDSIDELLTQMYASLNYIQTHHPYGDFPNQPSQAPQHDPAATTNGQSNALTNGAAAAGTDGPAESSSTPVPDTPQVFQSALREMAQSLVMQEQKAEILINSLPGIGSSQRAQEDRMRELEVELRQVELERARAEEEKERMINTLGEVLVGIKRVP